LPNWVLLKFWVGELLSNKPLTFDLNTPFPAKDISLLGEHRSLSEVFTFLESFLFPKITPTLIDDNHLLDYQFPKTISP